MANDRILALDPADTSNGNYFAAVEKTGDLEAVKKPLSDITLRLDFDIDDWNMDTTDSVDITHGLADGKIRGVLVEIRNDVTAGTIPLNAVLSASAPAIQGGVGSTVGGVTTLWRTTGGIFDSATYDQTSFNRGYVTIFYSK